MDLKIKEDIDSEPVVVKNIDWGDVIDMFGVQSILQYFIDGNENDDAIFECVDYMSKGVEEL